MARDQNTACAHRRRSGPKAAPGNGGVGGVGSLFPSGSVPRRGVRERERARWRPRGRGRGVRGRRGPRGRRRAWRCPRVVCGGFRRTTRAERADEFVAGERADVVRPPPAAADPVGPRRRALAEEEKLHARAVVDGRAAAPRRWSSATLKSAVASSSSGDARVSAARIAHAAGITTSVSPRLTSRAAKTPTPPASGVSPSRSACAHPSPSSHARSAAPRSNRSAPSTDAIARARPRMTTRARVIVRCRENSADEQRTVHRHR